MAEYESIIKIMKTKSKYEKIYVPVSDMNNVMPNATYKYDYSHYPLYETKMESEDHKFTILHMYEDCKYNPSDVTYIMFCPQCMNHGISNTTTYLHTKFPNLRFYLMHTNNCPINRHKKCKINANLLCDQCFDTL